MSMGDSDGAEICELVGLYLLTEIHKNIDLTSVGLFRDDGLKVMRSASGSFIDIHWKKLITLFQDNEHKCINRNDYNKQLRHKLLSEF